MDTCVIARARKVANAPLQARPRGGSARISAVARISPICLSMAVTKRSKCGEFRQIHLPYAWAAFSRLMGFPTLKASEPPCLLRWLRRPYIPSNLVFGHSHHPRSKALFFCVSLPRETSDDRKSFQTFHCFFARVYLSGALFPRQKPLPKILFHSAIFATGRTTTRMG